MWLILLIALLVFVKIYTKIYCGKCKSDAVLTGKVAIVTGANTGIGFETAKDLARRGARVYLACRNENLGNAAKEKIAKETKTNNVIFKKLDLSSLNSVREFVLDVKKNETKLDILINNAGAAALGNKWTSDGIIQEMQVNYFGPFLLTMLLVPLLKKAESARIVNVSSELHFYGTVNLKYINKERHYRDLKTYNNSKLCNVLFSKELAERLKGTTIKSNSLHPGHVRTSIYKNRGGIVRTLSNIVLLICGKSSVEGAQTSIYLAVSEDCDQVNGKYFVDCKIAPEASVVQDRDLRTKLWSYSEDLVKLSSGESVY